MKDLPEVAPSFVAIAHSIVWCTVATVAPNGEPRTRVLHPIWEWTGAELTGWVASSPLSPKAAHLHHEDRVSCTYWAPSRDTCTADARASWVSDPGELEDVWHRLASAPEPLGYDPSLIPAWESPASDHFGALRLDPHRLRVMPARALAGEGEVLRWSRSVE